MEVGSRSRWYGSVAALVLGVVALVGVVSWRVAVALPAPWVTPSVDVGSQAQRPSSAPTQAWTATIPAGWTVPADTYGSEVALVDANNNRISGDSFSQDAPRACAYLVDQQLSSQKATRTDLPGTMVDGRPAISVRLESTREVHLFRCFPTADNVGSWYLRIRYQVQDRAAAEQAFAAFADSFRLR